MKKLISVLLASAICLCFLCSCGVKEASLPDIMRSINSSYSLTGLTEISDKQALSQRYGVNPDEVKQFAAEYDAGASDAPLEIVLIEAEGSSFVQNIISKLSNRYNAIYNEYSSYGTEQQKILKNCTVTSDGAYVSLIVSTDPGGMREIYNSFIK